LARFRVRFLLQEFDLVGPEIVLGRSPDCQITIEDPLVSRRHARILIRAGAAVIEDLGSRNGVSVNGSKIDGQAKLRDEDRIRLGAQDLIFLVADSQQRSARPTGYIFYCQSCGQPYEEAEPRCPHCGDSEVSDEETVTTLAGSSANTWMLDLLREVIDRAIATGRGTEATRMMRRAAKEVDQRLDRNEPVERAYLDAISTDALRLAQIQGDPQWVEWVMAIHRRLGFTFSASVLNQVQRIDFDRFPWLKRDMQSFAHGWVRSTSDLPPER
jgi:hypothetical protein